MEINMRVRSFYEIPTSTYLFHTKIQDTPEEKVRQWAIFELISSYGYSILEISIEHPVTRGSKRIRADIVVHQNSEPFIIVECKREDVDENEEAWRQLLNYADQIKAEFAVWTNGWSWKICRRIHDAWHSISDIPYKQEKPDTNLAKHLQHLEEITCLLAWHNRSIPETFVTKFFWWFSITITPIIVENLSNSHVCLLNATQYLCHLADEIENLDLNADGHLQAELIRRLVIVLKNFEDFFELINFDGKLKGISGRYDIGESINRFESYISDEFEQSPDFKKKMASLAEGKGAKWLVCWEILRLSPCIRYLAQIHIGIEDEVLFLGASEVIIRWIVKKVQISNNEGLTEGETDLVLKVIEKCYLKPHGFYLPNKLDLDGSQNLVEFCLPYWQDYLNRSKKR